MLDLKDEYWQLIKDILPVLEPLKVATAFLSTETTPPASSVYPMLWGLLNVHLMEKDDECQATRDIKEALTTKVCHDKHRDSKESACHCHDSRPTVKNCKAFGDEFKKVAHYHVISLCRQSPYQNPPLVNRVSSRSSIENVPASAFFLATSSR